jgi:hypothetical protein
VDGITIDIEDLVPELPEGATLQWLCEEVSDHVPGWTVLNLYFASSNMIRNKEVADVYMTCLLTARTTSIFLKKHCALIVPVDD